MMVGGIVLLDEVESVTELVKRSRDSNSRLNKEKNYTFV